MSKRITVAVLVVLIALGALYFYQRLQQKQEDGTDGAEPKTADELAQYTGHPPAAWGKEAWHLMHIVAVNFPFNATDTDREAFSMFIAGLALVLPCGTCRSHFQQELAGEFAIQPKDLKDRLSVFSWTVRLHNKVNKRIGKNQPESVAHWFRHYTLLRQQH